MGGVILGMYKIPIFIGSSSKIMCFLILFQTKSWQDNDMVMIREQQLELHMVQRTGSKSGKEYVKAVYCHPAYLTYMQSTA